MAFFTDSGDLLPVEVTVGSVTEKEGRNKVQENMLALAKSIQETGQEYDFHIGGYSGIDF